MDPPDSTQFDLPKCSCSDCEETVEVTSGTHTNAAVDYGTGAPAGGPHNPCWSQWGVHTAPAAAERFVHNLEHGGIALLYNCADDCAEELAWIIDFTERNTLTLATEYPSLSTRFAVTAWGYRWEADCLDPKAIADFYQVHVDRGPEQLGLPPPQPPDTCPPE